MAVYGRSMADNRHKRVAATFRKTASNFHYEFNVRHVAGVFQGMLMGLPAQFQDPVKVTQLWLHESERVYGDRLVSVSDLKKYKDLAVEQAKKEAQASESPHQQLITRIHVGTLHNLLNSFQTCWRGTATRLRGSTEGERKFIA